MARLRTYVHVHTAPGEVVVYGPGDTVPAKHAKLITNPKAWVSDEQVEEPADPADPPAQD